MGDNAQQQKDTPRDKAKRRVGSSVCRVWRLDKLIGYGGMAAVYAATHDNGRVAALKIMHTELCRDEDVRERFLREGKIARMVDHPGVIRIIGDDVTESDEPFLVMELLRGRTLSSLWRKNDKQLPLEASLRIAARILSALAAFHARGIVHRDLKPANIFITREGQLKVLDLGVAQHREAGREMTRAGLAMGTPSYMAPEQALGKSESVDHRADIYAVGATLYALVSGKQLHRGATAQESHIMAATQPAPSVARVAPDLPVAAVALIDKALQWDPRNRHQSAKEMTAEIENLLGKLDSPEEEETAEEDELVMELDLDDGSIPSSTAASEVGHASYPSTRVSQTGGVSRIELAEPRAGAKQALRPAPTGLRRDSEVRRGDPGTLGGVKLTHAGPTDEIPLPGEHPLTALIITLDRLLKTARQYGPSHPETQSRLIPVFTAAHEALEQLPEGIHLRVLPFCFMQGDRTVWEPSPPGDLVPYTLSVAGVRELHISLGVEEAELRELVGAMMIDANTNPSDIATALWEAPFQHIQCRIEEDLGAEHAESLEDYFSEAAELERELQAQLTAVQRMALTLDREDVMEAAAMAAMREASNSTAEMLRLDDVSQGRLSRATTLSASELRARHDRLLVDAFDDAARRRDLDALVEAVSGYARRLVRVGRDDELYATHRALVKHVAEGRCKSRRMSPAFVTATLFPGDVLQHVVRTASGWSDLITESQQAEARAGFALLTQSMSMQALPMFLSLAERVGPGALLDHILAYVVRVSEGNEEAVLSRLETMDPVIAQNLLTVLIREGGERIKAKMAPLLASGNSALRCEAIALVSASHITLTQELMKLFLSDDRSVRSAALATFVRHKVRSAGPRLVTIVEHAAFLERPLDEQREIIEALWALNPSRSEKLLSELLGRHGLLVDERLDRTRSLAATVLGEQGETQRAHDALHAAEARRPWNSSALRAVAAHARSILLSRVVPVATPSGPDAEASEE